MSIYYPPPSRTTAGSSTANYMKHAIGTFSMDVTMNHTSSYTASFSASVWLVASNGAVPSGSTIAIAMPSASFVSFNEGGGTPAFYAPEINFRRIDNDSNVIIQLTSSDPNVVFGSSTSATSNFLQLSVNSLTKLVQVDTGYGMGGNYLYLILQQSSGTTA